MTLNHLQKWTLPKCYVGAEWRDYYRFLNRNRDSDALDRSNFDAGLAEVRDVASREPIPGDTDESATVQVVCENHWAVGWVEWIAIHESDAVALLAADAIMERLENYPVVSEESYCQYEHDEAAEVWRNCYRSAERIAYIRAHHNQFEFRDWLDLMRCVRGKYFAGYDSELL